MRNLAALNVYVMEEFEKSKMASAKTAEACVALEEKVAELRNIIADLEKNKAEYKNDRLVEKVISRANVAVNFTVKACGAFSSVADAVNENRAALDRKRLEAKENLDKNRVQAPAPKKEAPAQVVPPLPAVEKKKVGRPKKRR